MRRIVLVGYRGTGKTELGRELARHLNVPFLDTDHLAEEQAGRTIDEIFSTEGEMQFRAIEEAVIAHLPARDAVIGTGGGAVTLPANMPHLRKDSTLILLTADPAVIAERIATAPRPALTDLPAEEEIRKMLARRREQYAAALDFCIDTRNKTPKEVADLILRILKTGVPTPAARADGLTFFRGGRLPAPVLQRLEQILKNPPEDPKTRLVGVAGNPCLHSRGPHLFNALFKEHGLNYYYTFFEDPDIGRIMQQARALDLKGLSVTIPFKQSVMEHLDEIPDLAARQIGAVNTVVFACGRALGYNTDWLGVRAPLQGMKGAKAVLLGAGGVAAAAAYAMTGLEMDVTILNRTPEKAKELAKRSGCRWAAWNTFDALHPDLVVNTTPLGMEPDTRSPLATDQLYPGLTVFDLVYTPPITPLIERARAQGCTTITGTGMFAEQARAQFRLWFGIDLSAPALRKYIP